jgi:short-subunit dehydrogenase
MEYRNALITGASSGMGRGLAAWFANRGVRVFACGRRSELLAGLADEVKTGNIEPVALDVAKSSAVLERVREIDGQCGGLDLVIANAGVGGPTPAGKMDWKRVEQIIAVNVSGASATLCAALPGMLERGRGHLVGISSIGAYRGLPGSAAYCASKAYLSIFLESLRVDLVKTPLKVTCIYPGFVKSEMTAKNNFKMPFLLETEAAVERMGRAILRGQREYLFPWQLATAIKGVKVLPNALFDAAASRVRSS